MLAYRVLEEEKTFCLIALFPNPDTKSSYTCQSKMMHMVAGTD